MVNKKNILKFIFYFLVFLLIVPSIINLFHKGFFPTHDFIFVARIEQLDKQLRLGQFPVRWLTDFRYGDPTFNYYAPLPYYLGAVIHAFGFSYLLTSKILFALSMVLSFGTMYLLGKRLSNIEGGLLSAFLYLYAPYRSVDIFVRGAMSESWAFVFFPLILLFTYELINFKNNKYLILLSLSLAGLYYTHNIMTLLFLPFLVLFALSQILIKKDLKSFQYFISSLLLSLILGASYLLPAFLEKKYIKASFVTGGYFNFAGHFVAIKQWFIRFWGYGASLWGSIDDMSFQIGATHWFIIALVILGVIKIYFSKRKKEHLPKIFLISSIFALYVLSLFFQHNQSTFIWKNISLLAYTQFPWRFLALSVVFSSLIGTFITLILPNNKIGKIIIGILVITTIALNYAFFKPREYYLDSVDAHYVGGNVYAVDDKVPKDYLPIWVGKMGDFKKDEVLILEGDATITNFKTNNLTLSFEADVRNESIVQLPVTYFPGWNVRVNNAVGVNITPNDYGLITFNLAKGKYPVLIRFLDTPIRFFSNTITLGGVFIISYLWWKERKNIKHVKDN